MRRLNRILGRLRRELFPTNQDRMIKKWWRDGGDYALRFGYDLDENSLVLDLGGYQGQWASDIFSRYQCCVIVFEPVADFAEEIRKRFSRNSRIEVYRCGLGGSSRKDQIRVCANSSSLLGSSGPSEAIDIVDVRDWFTDKNITYVHVMKINIEGGEYELLERLIETGLIKMIENIQVQFHNVSKNSYLRMESIQDHLKRTHVPTYQYTFVWENWARKKQ